MQKINKINKIQKLWIINAIQYWYKIKYFKGTNLRGIDFLVLLGEIFVQVLSFMYFNPTVTEIFFINATLPPPPPPPSVRWRLLEGGVLQKGVYKIFKIKLGVYHRGHLKETGRLLESLLCHIWYNFGLWYNFAHSKAILFEKVKYCTVCANDKWQASYCMLPPIIWYIFLISYIFFISLA